MAGAATKKAPLETGKRGAGKESNNTMLFKKKKSSAICEENQKKYGIAARMGAFIAVSASLMTPVAAACVVLHGRQKDATGNAAGVPADAGLLEVISMVESKSNDSAIGDNGRALGRYQIWACYVADVNRIAGTSYSHSDVHNPAKARAMVETYLEHYGKRYAKKTGKKPTMEVLCRIHNGGPDGWKKDSTLPYWEKCKKAQRQLNRRTKK